jgi:hypothetical protein
VPGQTIAKRFNDWCKSVSGLCFRRWAINARSNARRGQSRPKFYLEFFCSAGVYPWIRKNGRIY